MDLVGEQEKIMRQYEIQRVFLAENKLKSLMKCINMLNMLES